MSEKQRIRKNQLRVWLNEEEKAILEKRANECGISQSDYIRQIVLTGGIRGRQWTMDREQGKQIIYEINRIGNDISQITYSTNAKRFAAESDWQKLKDEYFKLLTVIGQLPFLSDEAREEWAIRVFELVEE